MPTTPDRFATIEPGDLVDRPDKPELDARPVHGIADGMLTLAIGTLITDPIPASLYRVVRKADGSTRHLSGYMSPECTCVESCADHPPSACSLSGRPHVHPDDGRGIFGACPVHPDAEGDL